MVPEIAARAHVEALDRLIAAAMADAGREFGELDGVAAAAGPGLIGGVIVGLTTAKAIALVHEKPLIAVNHLEAHALTARLTHGTRFPYCLFLASGGHTQIVAVRGIGDYVRLGTTRDDAIGEAFDKTAKLLGLGYPGGPRVELEASRGDRGRFLLPHPMVGRQDADFSLSGLKTAVRLEAESIAPLSSQDVADLCASFQLAVIAMVADRLRGGPADIPAPFRCTDRAGSGRRCRRQSGDSRRVAGCCLAKPDTAGRSASGVVYGQRRHDRVGRRRTLGGGVVGCARCLSSRTVAARSGDETGCGRIGHAGRGRACPSGGWYGAIDTGVNMAADPVAVVGAGAWGIALANAVARGGRVVTLFARDRLAAITLSAGRTSDRLPGVRVDERITITSLGERRSDGGAVLLAVPAQALRSVAASLAGAIAPGTPVVSCAKGIERTTQRFTTEIIVECLADAVPAILSGPSFAADVARGLPTAVTVAAQMKPWRELGAPARFRGISALSFGRCARCRDRRCGQERAGDRGRHRFRPRPRCQCRGCLDDPRFRGIDALRQGLWGVTRDADRPVGTRRSYLDMHQCPVAKFFARACAR